MPGADAAAIRYIQLAGFATEVVSFAAASQPPALQVVLYPGNPGNACYYVPFMAALHEGLGGRVEVTGISNLGQCSDGLRGQVFSLGQQTAHKLQYLQDCVLGPGCPPAVLIGHSIGAHIALQNVRQLQQTGDSGRLRQIQKVVALFPFLEFDASSWRQWALSHLAFWPRAAGAAAAGLTYLPPRVQESIVRLFAAGCDEHAVETTLRMVSYSHVANALHLAHHEFTDLRAPTDWRLLQSLGDKLALVCAPRDKWFPDAQWQQLRRRLPALQASVEPAQKHGFCVSEALSRQLAAKTLQLMEAAEVDDAVAVAAASVPATNGAL